MLRTLINLKKRLYMKQKLKYSVADIKKFIIFGSLIVIMLACGTGVYSLVNILYQEKVIRIDPSRAGTFSQIWSIIGIISCIIFASSIALIMHSAITWNSNSTGLEKKIKELEKKNQDLNKELMEYIQTLMILKEVSSLFPQKQEGS